MRFKRWMLAAAAAAVALGAVTGSYAGGSKSEAAGAAKLRIGLVTDIGGLNDRGFNQLAFQGLKRAQTQLGVTGRVLTSSGPNDYIPNLSTLARQKYDLVIAVGFLMQNSVDTVSKQFPKTKFAIIDVDWTTLKNKPKNVQGLLFKEQEVGYLSGYIAALYAKDRGRVVSSVGGIKIPPVDRFIAGYQAGAKKAVPGTKTLNGYSQDFVDQAKCKEIALSQIAQGSKVVFQVAGGCGLGALDAAKENFADGVRGIGVDNDQAFLGRHVVTSARKKVDRAVFLVIQAVKGNKYRGGTNAVFGLKEGGVGLGKVQGLQPSWVKAAQGIAKQIVAGKIKPPTAVP